MDRRPVEMKPIPGFPPVPIYELPPPIAILPLPQDMFVFSVDDYRDVLKRPGTQFDKIGSSRQLRAVILDEIRKVEVVWNVKNQSFKTVREECCEVAAGIYRRTRVLLSTLSIWKFLQRAKRQLRRKLYDAMVKDKKTLQETENTLWEWDMYGYCRFLRPSFDTYTTKRAMGNVITLGDDNDNENEDFANDADETVEFGYEEFDYTHPAYDFRDAAQEEQLRSFQGTTQQQSALSQTRAEYEYFENTEGDRKRRSFFENVVQTPAAKRTAVRNSETPRRPTNDVIEHQEAFRQQLSEANVSQTAEPLNFCRPSTSSVPPQDRASSSRGSSSVPNQPAMPVIPVLPALDEGDYQAIKWNLCKIVREQPEKSNLLRGAILQVISRLETRVCNSLEDVFKDLAK